MNIFRKIFRVLSQRERRQVFLLVPLLGLTAVVEVAGIASILPFLALVADPGAVEQHPALAWLYQAGGFANEQSFLVATGALMFLFIVGSNALTAFNTWAVLRFSWMRNHSIALRLLRGYLGKPYIFFLDRHSADLGKNLVAEVQQVVSGILVPAMRAIARCVVGLAVLALLIYVDPILALLTALVLGGAYGLIFFAIRRQQRRMGQRRLAANRNRYETLAETFGGIKEIRLLGREGFALRRFSDSSYDFAATTAHNAVMAQLPRFALEAVAFGGIILIVLYLLNSGRPFREILPILGLYAFAGYRLMPSLQQIFHALTSIRFNAPALDQLLTDMPNLGMVGDLSPVQSRLKLSQSIRLRNVSFRYPTADQPLFRNLDLEIPAGTSVAFVGATGSGKSTLADLILGLLTPTEGSIEVDGTPLVGDDLRRWQRNLGYVPQMIFLANDTITRNIAFGLPDDEIDVAAVERAAETAHIDNFIRDELPEGYRTEVGERGVRLSGGQRQRIGIARALYQDPQVLVFDEATSALDRVTEEAVLEAVNRLATNRTLLMIAHRLSSVRDCDHIHLLAHGSVIDSGTYGELLERNRDFQAMATGSGA